MALTELEALIGLSGLESLPLRVAHALLDRYESAAAVVAAEPRELVGVPGVDFSLARRLHALDVREQALHRLVQSLHETAVLAIPFSHRDFPSCLAALPEPPLVLYVTGSDFPISLGHPTIAVAALGVKTVATDTAAALRRETATAAATICIREDAAVLAVIGQHPSLLISGAGPLMTTPFAAGIASFAPVWSAVPPRERSAERAHALTVDLITAVADRLILVEPADNIAADFAAAGRRHGCAVEAWSGSARTHLCTAGEAGGEAPCSDSSAAVHSVRHRQGRLF